MQIEEAGGSTNKFFNSTGSKGKREKKIKQVAGSGKQSRQGTGKGQKNKTVKDNSSQMWNSRELAHKGNNGKVQRQGLIYGLTRHR